MESPQTTRKLAFNVDAAAIVIALTFAALIRLNIIHRIKAAAKKFGVDMPETHWHQLGKHPHTKNSSN